MTNIDATPVTYRTMHVDDIAAGMRLSRANNWNQTSRDWELFLMLSPDGCRVAVKAGEVIGTVATVSYENRFAWIGMVLVDAAERGHGIGSRLMTEAIEALKDIPSIRLDATPAGREVYRRLNFIDEYGLSRMEGVVAGGNVIWPPHSARPMTKDDLSAVAVFDREVFGADRRTLLEWVYEGAPEYAWVSEGPGTAGQISGYTFGRHGTRYEHLGPVVARDQQTARQLVAACLSRQDGRTFILDASHHEPDWRAWLVSIGFQEQRPFMRMYYRDNDHPGVPSQQFGILGPEFG